jgi:hypothetical protein
MADEDALLGPLEGADHRVVGGVEIDVVRVGAARMQRVVYPPGYRWSTNLKPVVGTEQCMHGHVGMLVRGRMEGQFADGCRFAYASPQFVVLEPGHDAWVVGDERAVFIQFDHERDTVDRLGLPAEHRHD